MGDRNSPSVPPYGIPNEPTRPVDVQVSLETQRLLWKLGVFSSGNSFKKSDGKPMDGSTSPRELRAEYLRFINALVSQLGCVAQIEELIQFYKEKLRIHRSEVTTQSWELSDEWSMGDEAAPRVQMPERYLDETPKSQRLRQGVQRSYWRRRDLHPYSLDMDRVLYSFVMGVLPHHLRQQAAVSANSAVMLLVGVESRLFGNEFDAKGDAIEEMMSLEYKGSLTEFRQDLLSAVAEVERMEFGKEDLYCWTLIHAFRNTSGAESFGPLLMESIDEYLAAKGEMTYVTLVDKVLHVAKGCNMENHKVVAAIKPQNDEAKIPSENTAGKKKKKSVVCFRCGREGHYQNQCKEVTHKNGTPLESSDSKTKCDDNEQADGQEREKQIALIRQFKKDHYSIN